VTSLLAALAKAIFSRDSREPGASLSDNLTYPEACRRAATEPEFFASFRRHPDYTRILEHVTAQQGQAYLDLIARDAELFAAIDTFRLNDLYGNPVTHAYPAAGKISPSTLRYVKVLADLQAAFGNLDGLDVCEIGVGYGGQCRVIDAWCRPASYCLVDIAPALALARRYFDNFSIDTPLTYQTMDELGAASFDLAISNYAFTELARPLQDIYLAKVILRSRMGYITYNEVTPAAFNSYKAEQLLETIPGATRLEEKPLTHPGNCIIVWGANATAT
jgi:hypothetical protein